MTPIELILGLLLIAAAVAWLAERLHIPSPIALTIGGVGLALVPGLPKVELKPELVFLLFLPPLLYWAAIQTSWRDFKHNGRAIGWLAVGLVIITTVAVALVAKWLVPGMGWPAAFVLGAIVSPPDAVAASAIAQRLHIPRRLVVILEGESLVNDATALVAYRFAIAAAVTGAFSLNEAWWTFLLVAGGGVAVGLVVGIVIAWVRPRLKDGGVETTLSLLTPYVAYVPAEWLHVSGVLATVTAGIYMSRRIPTIVSARVRVRSVAVWEAWVFILNALVFILIGLQLPFALERLQQFSFRQLVSWATVMSAVAVVVRMAWVFPATYVPRWLSPKLRKRDPAPPWQHAFLVAWTGMRGIVSLAAALALPRGFPHRALILFLTFAVILFTLVCQGLSLPLLIRRFGLKDDGEDEQEEMTARHAGALAALTRLQEMEQAGKAPGELIERYKRQYDERLVYALERLTEYLKGEPSRPAEADGEMAACRTSYELGLQLLGVERKTIVLLRDRGMIGDEALRRIQEELDLDEARLG